MNRITRHRILMVIIMMGVAFATLALIGMPSFAAYESSLQGYWKLNETSGTTAFNSVGNNNGTTTGATVNTSGKFGTAYSFDGNDYVTISSPPAIVGPFTVTVWFKQTSGAGAWPGIISNNDWAGFGAWFGDREVPYGVTGQIGGTALYGYGYATSLNIWYMLTLRFDGTNKEMYINNTKVASVVDSTINPSGTMTLGAWWYNTRLLTGAIDDIAFWNRGLSSAEITQLNDFGTEAFELMTTSSYSTSDMDSIYSVYTNQSGSYATSDGKIWTYVAPSDPVWTGHSVGDVFITGSDSYMMLGGGVKGSSGSSGGGAVPEPATVVGLVIAAIGMVARKRMRSLSKMGLLRRRR